MVYDPELIKNKDLFNNFSSDITCAICEYVVTQPKICCSCQKSFCSECLNKWVSKSQSCPFKCKDFKIGDASRIVKNLLEALEFVCLKCDKAFGYLTFPKHIAACESIKHECPMCLCKTIPKDQLGIIKSFNDEIKRTALADKDLQIKKLQEDIAAYEARAKKLETQVLDNSKIELNSIKLEPLQFETDLFFPKSFEQSGTYKYYDEIAGTNKLSDLRDRTCLKGICTGMNGIITFEFAEPIEIGKIEIGGYQGKKHFWSSSNGAGSIISVSMNKTFWTDIGSLSSSYGPQIEFISSKVVQKAKYLRFSCKLYLGIGYLKVYPQSQNKVEKKVEVITVGIKPSINNHSQILCYSECKLFYKNGRLVGSDDIACLENPNLSKKQALCLNTPGKIVFELYQIMEIASLTIGGYSGDGANWYCENGVGATIELSTDEENFKFFGKIPYSFGSGLKKIVGGPILAKFVKISCNSYLGIGYLKFNV